MTTIERLKAEAADECRFRGHDMTRFSRCKNDPNYFMAACRVCGEHVEISFSPRTNGGEIVGTALMQSCESIFPEPGK